MPKAWLLLASGLLLAGVISGIILAVLSDDDELLSAASPEGAVQRYILALRNEDYRDSYTYLSEELKEGCSYEQYVRWKAFGYLSRDAQVTLERTRMEEGIAQVTVLVTETVQIFPPAENTYEQTFHLKLEDEQWRFVVLPFGPWPCP